jgi:hypothetical protein
MPEKLIKTNKSRTSLFILLNLQHNLIKCLNMRPMNSTNCAMEFIKYLNRDTGGIQHAIWGVQGAEGRADILPALWDLELCIIKIKYYFKFLYLT